MLTLIIFLILIRLLSFELKSIVNLLIKPPMKDFLSSFSSVKSLNSSSIGWNNSLMVSAMLSVESCPSLESLIIFSIFFYYFVYHFCFGFVNRSFLFPAVLSWPCSPLDIFYPFFPGGLQKKLELVSLFCLKFLNFYVLYLIEHTRIVSLEFMTTTLYDKISLSGISIELSTL